MLHFLLHCFVALTAIGFWRNFPSLTCFGTNDTLVSIYCNTQQMFRRNGIQNCSTGTSFILGQACKSVFGYCAVSNFCSILWRGRCLKKLVPFLSLNIFIPFWWNSVLRDDKPTRLFHKLSAPDMDLLLVQILSGLYGYWW